MFVINNVKKKSEIMFAILSTGESIEVKMLPSNFKQLESSDGMDKILARQPGTTKSYLSSLRLYLNF